METTRLPPDVREHREMLRSWIRKVGLQNAPCVLGLPGQQCMFQPVLLTPKDARSFEQVAAMELLQFNEMAQETMVYGFSPVKVTPGERRMLLAMARPSVLDGMLGLAKDIGVRAVDLAPLPAALHHWAAACAKPHTEPRLYLNVGLSSTEMAIGVSDSLMFARAFGTGGQMFTEAYSRAAGIPSAQAEAAKVRDGSLIGESPAAQALRSSAQMWISELRAAMSVFRSVYGDKKNQPARVVLAGKGAQLNGFTDFVSRELALPVEWLPAGNGLDSPDLYGPAAGLAWAGTGRTASPLSLLPPGVRHELMFRKQKPFWIGAGIAASLILGVSLAGGYVDIKRKEALLRNQKTSLGRRQQLAGDIEAIEKSSDAMLLLAAPVQRMTGTGPLIRDLLSSVSGMLESGDWIVKVCDAESYFSFKAAPDSAGSRRGMRDNRRPDPRKALTRTEGLASRFIIEGRTRNRSLVTVKKLIAELEKKDFVESADLLSDDQLIGDSGSDPSQMWLNEFVLDVRVRHP
jgi:Tfp pilus assembly PilM family ATPase